MCRQNPRTPQNQRLLGRAATYSRPTHMWGYVACHISPRGRSLYLPWTGLELCGIFDDGVNQAADFFSEATSIPSGNVTPLTTFGN